MNFSQATAFILVLALCFYRLYVAFTSKPPTRPRNSSATTRSLAVFLGSGHSFRPELMAYTRLIHRIGGHTSEALQLLSSLDFTRYTPRRYIISSGDHLSAQKAAMLEQAKASPLGVRKISVFPSYALFHRTASETQIKAGLYDSHNTKSPSSASINLLNATFSILVSSSLHLLPHNRAFSFVPDPNQDLDRCAYFKRTRHLYYAVHSRSFQ
jgi:hypothetical protein